MIFFLVMMAMRCLHLVLSDPNFRAKQNEDPKMCKFAFLFTNDFCRYSVIEITPNNCNTQNGLTKTISSQERKKNGG